MLQSGRAVRHFICYLTFACATSSAAEDVIILEVTGHWTLVGTSDNHELVRLTSIAVGQKIRFKPDLPPKLFSPGSIVFGVNGKRYDSIPCNAPAACAGVMLVPQPKASVASRPSTITGQIASAVRNLLSGTPIYSNAIGSPPKMGGGAATDAVLELRTDQNGASLVDVCDSIQGLGPGAYSIEIAAPSGQGQTIQEKINSIACPADIAANGLSPGIYRFVATDSAGDRSEAFVLICGEKDYKRFHDTYSAISRETEAWLEPDANGVRVQSSTRRLFLVGWLATQAPLSSPAWKPGQ